MTFIEWLFSSYPNPAKDGQWGWLHICVMICCALFIVGASLYFRGKRKDDVKQKRMLLFILAGTLLFFELSRRALFFLKEDEYILHTVLRTIFPRPWCAISCWMVMLATVINKKFFYNFASITSILCGAIFFAYPGAGFNNEYILFENLYSIVTHSVFFTVAILFITLGFTDFQFKEMWKELICLGGVYLYGAFETWGLQIEKDPLYYLPGNEIIELFGMPYEVYVVGYIAFIAVFWLTFYVIQNRKMLFAKKKA